MGLLIEIATADAGLVADDNDRPPQIIGPERRSADAAHPGQNRADGKIPGTNSNCSGRWTWPRSTLITPSRSRKSALPVISSAVFIRCARRLGVECCGSICVITRDLRQTFLLAERKLSGERPRGRLDPGSSSASLHHCCSLDLNQFNH